MNHSPCYAVGLMSGTSMDGVDAVCARITAHRFDGVVAHVHVPFAAQLRDDLLALQNSGTDELRRAAVLKQTLSEHYVQAVERLFRQPEMQGLAVEVIGCHGQTVRHAPQAGYSIQLADWAMLAERTALPVAGDFRAADIAAGGQGAPLVPAFHRMLFAHDGQTRVVLNLGGIANLTVLAADGAVTGFDSGPANMLMDAWVQQYFDCAYDEGGVLARGGQVLPELLAALLADDYFAQKPPKSTGRDGFSLTWLAGFLHGGEAAQDVLRTLLELTAHSAAAAVQDYAPDAQELCLCGGGADNVLLRERLAQLLPQLDVYDTDRLGLPPTQVEAAAFAWLAHCRVHRIPANLPAVTGARGARVLGALWESV